MTLLVVDDEARIRDLIRKYAAFEGYNVEEASNGMEAIEKCRQKNYDLIIMDVMMPELDGFSACREIRRKSQVPVIMLSARGEEYDRIHGFELGIDDYVVKPFSPRELMMRVSAVLKRTAANAPAASDGEQVTIGDMVVDFAARQVTIKGEKLNLSPKEYDLLFYMGDRFSFSPLMVTWRKAESVPQGVRPAVLHGAQPRHCPDAREAHQRRMGLRFLRRRPHAGHAHQAASQEFG